MVPAAVAPVRLTVKLALPAPSKMLSLLAATLQTDCSLSWISTVMLLVAMLPALAPERVALKLSLGSTLVSSVTATLTLLLISPAAKVRVWVAPV